jgi:predicted nuclease of restriction endonuclease-like (RecB) superfamily
MNPALIAPPAQLPGDYPELLAQLKARITTARTRAALAVNRELVVLYWEIGRHILQRERQAGWGAKVIEQLAADLRREFPDMTGLSRRNLHYMRQFAAAWPERQIVQRAAAQMPWGHNVVLLDKLSDPAARRWYAARTIENGWSQRTRSRSAPIQRPAKRACPWGGVEDSSSSLLLFCI